MSSDRKAEKRAYYLANKERIKKQTKEYQAKNKEKCSATRKAWYEKNKEYRSEYHKHYRQSQREKWNAKCAKDRSARKKATCPLTPVEQEWLQFYYDDAAALTKETDIKHEVDHIKPISKGGLHAPWNLQVLTMVDNRSKGATWHSEAA